MRERPLWSGIYPARWREVREVSTTRVEVTDNSDVYERRANKLR